MSLFSCSYKNYSPGKKHSKVNLENDFKVLKSVLQNSHPGVYTFQTKENFEKEFEFFNNRIKDSLTELQFGYRVVAPFLQKIRCGHTSMQLSKNYYKWINNNEIPALPFQAKVWNDTIMSLGNYFKKDSVLKRGVIIKAINNVSAKQIIDSFQNYISVDGYNKTFAMMRISNSFSIYHRTVYNLKPTYKIDYLDLNGDLKTHNLVLLDTIIKAIDSSKVVETNSKPIKKARIKKIKLTRKQKQLRFRSFNVDTINRIGTIILNTFSEGCLRKFFRKTFKKIEQEKINKLIIDVRMNGGGKVINSTLLTKYCSKIKFKILDSAVFNKRTLAPNTKYFKSKFLPAWQLFFGSKKNTVDNKWHYKYYENRIYKPKKNAFDGNLVILTSGFSFSASCLFANNLKGQNKVTIVGEETGGGWEQNNGFVIPKIVLPNSRLRVRIPLVKVYLANHKNTNGSGIIPDVTVPPNYKSILINEDIKTKVAKSILLNKN